MGLLEGACTVGAVGGGSEPALCGDHLRCHGEAGHGVAGSSRVVSRAIRLSPGRELHTQPARAPRLLCPGRRPALERPMAVCVGQRRVILPVAGVSQCRSSHGASRDVWGDTVSSSSRLTPKACWAPRSRGRGLSPQVPVLELGTLPPDSLHVRLPQFYQAVTGLSSLDGFLPSPESRVQRRNHYAVFGPHAQSSVPIQHSGSRSSARCG